MDLIISPDGSVRCLYSDTLSDLLPSLGSVSIARASHVEPNPAGGWLADMDPVDGPVLGPFTLRAEALAAEVAWLIAHDIPVPKGA